jgi:hypothetical protein
MNARPPLDGILNLHDFEVRDSSHYIILHTSLICLQAIAKLVMPDKAWAYYSSAADDEITLRENHAAYHRHVHLSDSIANNPLTGCITPRIGYGSDQESCVMSPKLTFLQRYLDKNPPCLSISYVNCMLFNLSINKYFRRQRPSENWAIQMANLI